MFAIGTDDKDGRAKHITGDAAVAFEAAPFPIKGVAMRGRGVSVDSGFKKMSAGIENEEIVRQDIVGRGAVADLGGGGFGIGE